MSFLRIAVITLFGAAVMSPPAFAGTPSGGDGSRAQPDFNGDGFADLAVGSPHEDVGARDTGSVSVIYGSAIGLTATGNQFWTQDSPGVLDRAERSDQFGWALATADFDGDRFTDLAVGVRFEMFGAEKGGGVNVLYGSANGLTATGNQLWSQDSPGVLDQAERDDTFGWSLAAEDFNGDGFADLAVGVHFEDLGAAVHAGAVNVIYGSEGGLTAAGNQAWTQDSPGIKDHAELRDQFGQSLAAADFDGDGFGDLAVGVWFEDSCFICNEGAVHVIYGSRRGLTAAGDQLWNQDSPGIPDTSDIGDQFGQSLAAGDFNDDGYDDLAVGVPWEDFTTDVYQDLGVVHAVYGSSRGLRPAGNQVWSQDSPGILESAARDDHFSEALAAADFDGNGSADLAIGVPWEDFAATNDGGVNVIYGSRGRLRTAGNQFWSQDSPGFQDSAESHDRFGWSLSTERPRAGTPRTCYGNRGGPC